MTATSEEHRLAVGVDVGGSNIRLAVYRDLAHPDAHPDARPDAHPDAPRAPEPVARHREPVGEDRSPEAVAGALAERIDALLAPLVGESPGALATVPVGVGIAAIMRGDGTIANAPNLHWRDVPFRDLLRARLGTSEHGPRRVGLYNDVAAITYGEWQRGAGVGADDVLVVFVGTGVGGGIVAGGRLLRGASHCAGEIGHVKVVYGDDARLCGCGRRGCVEAYIGGACLEARARVELAGGARSAAVRLAGGDPAAVHPGHLDSAAAEGDRYALDLYAQIAPLLAAAIGNAVTVLNPSRLILGGGVLTRTPVLREHVITALELAINPALWAPLTLVEPMLGDDAGMVGSALMALNEM